MSTFPTKEDTMQGITVNGVTYNMSDESFALVIEQAAREERERGLANLARADRSGWCQCSEMAHDGSEESLYHTPEGRHGFFHDPLYGGCGRITQTG